MKTIISLAVVAILAVLPAVATAEMFGLGPEPTPTPQPVVATGQTFGLGLVDRSQTICFTWPDGRQECFTSAAAFEAATGMAFQRTRTVSTTVLRPAPKPATVSTFGISTYAAPGYHRHLMVDGSIMEHADSNYGSAVAHRGVAGRGWPKYYGPAAPSDVVQRSVQRSVTRQQLVAVDCPTCPSGVWYEMRTVTVPVAVAQKSSGVSYSRSVQRSGGWYPGRLLQRTRAAVRSRALLRPLARSRAMFRSSGG